MNASARFVASRAASRDDLVSSGGTDGAGAATGAGAGAGVAAVVVAPIPTLAARFFFLLILGFAALVPKVMPAPATRPPVFAGVEFGAGVTDGVLRADDAELTLLVRV